MIRIGVQTAGPVEAYGVDGGYKAIREAGFDAVDANIDQLITSRDIRARQRTLDLSMSDRDFLEMVRPWKEGAEKYGLDNYQAHSIFPSYLPETGDGMNDYLTALHEKMIMACDYMNCRNLVVHPFFLDYPDQTTAQDEWDTNIERYSRLIPAAKRYGVTICLENMFAGFNGKLYGACCSDITAACRYIDTLNDIAGQKVFAFCLDTGHLLLAGREVKSAMTLLGGRIAAFHVHDNNGVSDQHLAPYMGVLDWDRFMQGLGEIGYDKTMCFETFNVWKRFDKALCPDVLRLIAHAGRMFAQRAGAARG